MSVTEARPVSERIASQLYSRLRLLAAGYSDQVLVPSVKRTDHADDGTPEHLQIVLTQGSPQRNEELDCPGNPPANAYDIQFNIRVRVMLSESDPTPEDEIVNTIAAEVVRVVCDDSYLSYPWHTFENLAVNAVWQSHENVDGDELFDGVNIPLLVTYRVSETNPYEVRA